MLGNRSVPIWAKQRQRMRKCFVNLSSDITVVIFRRCEMTTSIGANCKMTAAAGMISTAASSRDFDGRTLVASSSRSNVSSMGCQHCTRDPFRTPDMMNSKRPPKARLLGLGRRKMPCMPCRTASHSGWKPSISTWWIKLIRTPQTTSPAHEF